jgi:type III pantothenate kinase
MNGLLIDVGNTTLAVARCDNNAIGSCRRISSTPDGWSEVAARDLFGELCSPGLDSLLSSVVPRLNSVIAGLVEALTGKPPLVLGSAIDLGIAIDYPKPETIGADRLANAVGAVRRYGAPVIVADFGTALTFDVVQAGGVYTGGVILPGLPFMTDYLAYRTALLPRIELVSTVGGIGRSTREAMEIGAVIGYRGMVREVVAHLKRAMGPPEPRVCATGGNCETVLGGAGMDIALAPTLNMEGLRDILFRNVHGPGITWKAGNEK